MLACSNLPIKVWRSHYWLLTFYCNAHAVLNIQHPIKHNPWPLKMMNQTWKWQLDCEFKKALYVLFLIISMSIAIYDQENAKHILNQYLLQGSTDFLNLDILRVVVSYQLQRESVQCLFKHLMRDTVTSAVTSLWCLWKTDKKIFVSYNLYPTSCQYLC